MVTTTSYGTWLPGDLRGYVNDGIILPPNPRLLNHARSLLSQAPVYFTDAQQIVLFLALRGAAEKFGYRLTDASVESWHLHWMIEHGYDPVQDMVGRLKTRMRQMVRRGRIWTRGYCHRCFYGGGQLNRARRYIARHAGCRLTRGRMLNRSTISGDA